MKSETTKKHSSNKKYLRQDKNYCLVSKIPTKHFLAHNPIVKIGNREIATELTKCKGCQKNKSTFLKEIKPKKKIFQLLNMDYYCKNCKKHTESIYSES